MNVYWVTLLVMTVGAAAFLAWPSILGTGSVKRRAPALWVAALAVPLLALTIESIFLKDNRSNSVALPAGLESIAWPGSSAMTRPAPVDPATSVAPVSALLDGLETRLAVAPDDAKGWALLAQSYAFIGERQQAETAIAKAVELGFDEADLRGRVELAVVD